MDLVAVRGYVVRMEPLRMKQTPSALKWLAERRARVSHELEQARRIASEHAKRAESLALDLESLDRSIRLYDRSIDPECIESIHGWRGRYGKRGGLRQSVLDILRERSPDWVLSGDIEALVCAKFGLSFPSPRERKQWYAGGFRATLKKLVEDGLVDRANDPLIHTGSATMWRLKTGQEGSLADLSASLTRASGAGAVAP